MMTILLLAGGLTALTIGAELLVRGAAGLAAAMKISALVIGLTVVAFGTSAPELVVSVQSALRGQPDLAVGNVVGSNIFNVLFILGVSAVIVPLVVAQQLVRFDVPLMIAVSGIVAALALDGRLGRLDGLLLFSGVVAYTLWAIVVGRREQKPEVVDEYAAEFGQTAPATAGRIVGLVVLAAVGLGLLVLGSRWFTSGAVEVARWLGAPDLVIGLTIVAAGTSLPEVATSIMAAVRGERDIAVGNVVGSNLFNLMAVLGTTALIAPEGVAVSQAALRFDIPVMIAVAVACLPVFFTGHTIARWEGALFLAMYAAYVAYLILAAAASPALHAYQWAMLWFAVPLVLATLAASLFQARASRRKTSR